MYNQLTREQRYAIYLGIQEKNTQTAIALQIGVHKSTASRELKRNSNRFRQYGWKAADDKAQERRERIVRNRKISPSILKEARRLLLSEKWSPRQISGWPKQRGMQVSHERIYEMIRDDDSGELRYHCRHRMKYRRHKKHKRPTRTTNIPNKVSIHERTGRGLETGRWT